MGRTGLWTYLLTLVSVSSLILGARAASDCSNTNLAIDGGNYTPSNGFKAGSVVTYHCPRGYYSPVKRRTCQSDGEWDPRPRRSRPSRPGLQCKLVRCPDPLGFKHGSVSPLQDKYEWNDTTTYDCYSDYTLTGSATRVCNANGKWSGRTPICGRNSDHCPDPGVPAGTRRTGDEFHIGDKVSYRCEDGLTLIGSKERICLESTEWTGQEPECYYEYTYDTAKEIAAVFSKSLQTSLTDEALNQEGKKVNLAKDGKLHIFIAIDGSDSIDINYFNKSRTVVKQLIEKISYYEVTPKYDIMIFATDVHKIVDIKTYYRGSPIEPIEVMQKLDEFEYLDIRDRGTNIAEAFNDIYKQMSWIKTKPEFVNSSHVIIMFTDGEANMGGKPEGKIKQIEDLVLGNRDSTRTLDIYMFGVGEDVQKEDLNKYATKKDKEKHVFYVEDMDKMHATFDEMLDESTNVGLCGLHRDYRFEDTDKYRPLRQPWLVKIYVRHEEGPSSNCLGSLITPRFILTAAHCFKFGDRKDRIEVTLNSGRAPVKRHILHKEYNIGQKKKEGIPEFYDYDVALIELEETVEITAKTRTICIPCTEQTSAALRLVGADATCEQHEKLLLNKEDVPAIFLSPERKMKNALIKQQGKVVACFEKATNAYGVSPGVKYTDIVTERFLCTGGIDPQTDDAACKGDSGGALFVERNSRSFQVGIISWGVSNVCTGGTHLSNSTHRDYHISLFKVKQFLEENLKNEITFIK